MERAMPCIALTLYQSNGTPSDLLLGDDGAFGHIAQKLAIAGNLSPVSSIFYQTHQRTGCKRLGDFAPLIPRLAHIHLGNHHMGGGGWDELIHCSAPAWRFSGQEGRS